MRIAKVTYSELVSNRSDFSSKTIGIEMEVAIGDNPIEVLNAAKAWVKERHANPTEVAGEVFRVLPDEYAKLKAAAEKLRTLIDDIPIPF